MTTKEELENKLKEIDKKFDEFTKLRNWLSDMIDDYKQDLKSIQDSNYGLWKPKVGGRFYFINYVGHIECEVYLAESPQDFYISIGNCFKTKEDAEKHLEHLKVETQLRDIAARLNKGREIDWGNEETKYSIIYNCTAKDLRLVGTVNIKSCDIYCLDENFKDTAISEIGEERLRNYLKEC